MKIENSYLGKPYTNMLNPVKKPLEATFDIQSIQSTVNEEEQVGYVHYAEPDTELRMYKVDSDTDDLLYRVETLHEGKLVKSQVINPEKVNIKSATTEELFALNKYLHDKKINTENFSIIDSNMMAEYHSKKFNALGAEIAYTNDQLITNNIEVYLLHKKLLDLLNNERYDFMRE